MSIENGESGESFDQNDEEFFLKGTSLRDAELHRQYHVNVVSGVRQYLPVMAELVDLKLTNRQVVNTWRIEDEALYDDLAISMPQPPQSRLLRPNRQERRAYGMRRIGAAYSYYLLSEPGKEDVQGQIILAAQDLAASGATDTERSKMVEGLLGLLPEYQTKDVPDLMQAKASKVSSAQPKPMQVEPWSPLEPEMLALKMAEVVGYNEQLANVATSIAWTLRLAYKKELYGRGQHFPDDITRMIDELAKEVDTLLMDMGIPQYHQRLSHIAFLHLGLSESLADEL